MKKHLLIIALFAISSNLTFAQTHFTLKLGGAFPQGKFADANANYNSNNLDWGLNNKSTKGGAGLGFNVGVQLAWDIASMPGLSFVASVDGFLNGANEDIKDFFYDYASDIECDYSIPYYINIPAMVGLNYGYKIAPNVKLFGEVAAGANYRYITNLEISVSDGRWSEEYTQEYDSKVTFGYRLTAGVKINEKYPIELGYYNLGAGKVKFDWEEWEDGESDGSGHVSLKSITPTILSLRLGIDLKSSTER